MTWQRVDLSDPKYAEPSEPPITCGLLYRGLRHSLTGAPEAAKTLTALILGLEHVRAGHGSFALVDFEMGEKAVRRLLGDLGASIDEIAAVYYIAPDGPPQTDDISALAAANVTLVIIDAAASAYDVSDLDDNKRADAERFGRVWIEPLWRLGISSLLIDHVVKNAENRGKFAIGSERKLGAIDVALGLEAVKQLHRGATGVIRVTTNKDRPGYLPRPRAAEIELVSDPHTHAISWTFNAATSSDPETGTNAFRPTHLMACVVEYLREAGEPVSRNAIATAVTGRREYVLKAISCLIEDGEIEERDRKITLSSGSGDVPGTEPVGNGNVPTPYRAEPGTRNHERAQL